MKKQICTILLVFAFCICCVLQASAEQSLPCVVDNANLLTDSQESTLTAKLDKIREQTQCDVLVVTIQSIGTDYSDAKDYADSFFNDNGYGFGDDRSGILLLLSMDNRDWAISTSGSCKTAFTQAGQEHIIEEIKPELSSENYAEAFTKYADFCNDFIVQAKTDEPYYNDDAPKEKMSKSWIAISLVVGVLLAFAVAGNMKGKLKTVHSQAAAQNYEKDGSLNIVNSMDIFLYKTVNSVRKQKNNYSSNSENGGSEGKF